MEDARTATVIDPEVLKTYAEPRKQGDSKPYSLITSKRHPSLPIAIHNYTFRAFKSSSSDKAHICEACRSLVTEVASGTVVARSFSKFFNYSEKGAYKPTGDEYRFVIEEKLDGSLIMLFYYSGEWRIASRTSFDSPHTAAAWEILRDQYSPVISHPQKFLDEQKTYVFELIHPRHRVQVNYTYTDLVLLTIVAKDGSEPLPDFDWSILPFRRPKPQVLNPSETLDPSKLNKLDLDNEEGFVVKFWRTQNDTHPQRIKIKLQSYLEFRKPVEVKPTPAQEPPRARKSTGLAMAHLIPPSTADIVSFYKAERLKIPSLDSRAVSSRLTPVKAAFLEALEAKADDYGGDAWVAKVEGVWNRVHAIHSLWEDEWEELLEKLGKEGYHPTGKKGKKTSVPLATRIVRNDIDPEWRPILRARFEGKGVDTILPMIIGSVALPKDLRQTSVVVL